MELGNAREATAELMEIAAEYQEHPDVLEVRWRILADLKRWEAALDVTRMLLARAPDRLTGWILQAYALRRVQGGGLEQARMALLPAVKQFPKENIVPFNLACYAAQLGQLQEAWDWLQQAMKVAGNIENIKKRALAEEDLQPLWERLKAL